MLGIRVKVPVATFRKGMAREYLETELVPPPSTCYGFLLALIGEVDRERHIGVRVAPMLLGEPYQSVVLRTVWRMKTKVLGGKGNTRPDFQQVLTGVDLVVWLDSTGEEHEGPDLERRVSQALDQRNRGGIRRFGGLSLGESTHLVDTVDILDDEAAARLGHELEQSGRVARLYRLQERGLLGLPVWVDHVGSAKTVHVVGELVPRRDLSPPRVDEMPRIDPRI